MLVCITIINGRAITLISLFSDGAGLESLVLKDKYVRKPLKMDAPEEIIYQAFGQARPVTDFLHENGELLLLVFFSFFPIK